MYQLYAKNLKQTKTTTDRAVWIANYKYFLSVEQIWNQKVRLGVSQKHSDGTNGSNKGSQRPIQCNYEYAALSVF